jgi:TM2 domain-containing membrane protein YozV
MLISCPECQREVSDTVPSCPGCGYVLKSASPAAPVPYVDATIQSQILVEQLVATEAPSLAVAYLLWLCLGLFSAHRFYLRRPGSAVLQILSYFVIIGFLWWLVDAMLIPGMVREMRFEIRARLNDRYQSAAEASGRAPYEFGPDDSDAERG